jgi:16S rRNA (guanine527-N7)-methyltransferase
MTPEAALAFGVNQLELQLPERAQERLITYMHLLEKWNRTYNLTSIRDPIKMVSHHLLDSLAVLAHLPPGPLADVGSGGGLPGIPIAIAEPARPVTLSEASEKKATFLRQATIELGLKNTKVRPGRAEDWLPEDRFAVVISRAFAELAAFISVCRHLVVPGGVLAAMKGLILPSELAGIPADADCGEVVRLKVPLLAAERHLVLCRVTA